MTSTIVLNQEQITFVVKFVKGKVCVGMSYVFVLILYTLLYAFTYPLL